MIFAFHTVQRQLRQQPVGVRLSVCICPESAASESLSFVHKYSLFSLSSSLIVGRTHSGTSSGSGSLSRWAARLPPSGAPIEHRDLGASMGLQERGEREKVADPASALTARALCAGRLAAWERLLYNKYFYLPNECGLIGHLKFGC